MNEVEKKFESKAIKRGGIFFYTKEDTLEFIHECKKHKIGILGIDGFFLTETTTQPSMEDSIDFSSLKYTQNASNQYKDYNTDVVYNDSIELIRTRGDDMYFEIVCND